MRNLTLLFIFIPFFLFSQTKRDLKKYNKIVDLIEKNELETALSETYKILETNKEWNKPNLLLSKIYFLKRNFEKGEKYFLKYYSLHSKKNTSAIFQLSQIFYSNGMYNKALKYLLISKDLSQTENKYKRMINNCRFAIDAMENPVEFEYKNMGENINTEHSEYLPFISVDGEKLIFTRLLPGINDEFQEDFYFSIKSDSNWIFANEMEINTQGNEGSVCISPNGNYLIYTACNRIDTRGRCDLYICVKQKDGSWSEAENLSSINTRYWESQACFSSDMKYLYFVSDRRGGYGGDDIWRSEITKFGFSEPENLGPKINTFYNEMSPFLHSDNLTFYFASEGHTGMGGFDLFVSKRSHSDTTWNTPENMGYPINTYKTENSLAVSSDGKTAYFVSDREGFGKEDIFSFELPENTRAEELSALELEIISKEFGEEIILNNVLFDTDSYMLLEHSFMELNLLLSYLKNNPSVNIHIEGHTDNVGEKDHNLILSENRAKEVFYYLKDSGISSKRLSFKGYGESNPIESNNTELGRSKNRRTSFTIVE